MKLSELAINVERVEQGDWVEKIPEMEGLRLKVRGSNNKDWRKLQQRLINAVPRKKRIGGILDPTEMDKITSVLLLSTCLLDWSGLEDDNDKPIPYSKEKAQEFLTDPQYGKFRDGVIWAAGVVAEQEVEEQEDDAKN